MFKTLQPDRSTSYIIREGIEDVPRQACIRCRTMKLKCISKPDGCERCVKRGLNCQYMTPSSQGISDTSERNAISQIETIDSAPRTDVATLLRETFDTLSSDQTENAISDLPSLAQASVGAVVDECSCAARLQASIETLEAAILHTSASCIDRMLCTTKRTFTDLREMQSCLDCLNDANIAMLRVVVCQKLNFAHEHVLNILGSEYNNVHASDDFPLAETSQFISPSLSDVPTHELFLESYKVDDAERPCVFGGIVVTQLWALKSFVRSQRRTLQGQDWLNHSMLVDTVEQFIDDQLRRCQKR